MVSPLMTFRDAVAVVLEPDVDGVRVAEEVVQIPEDLLVGAAEEHAEQIVLARRHGVDRQEALHLFDVDEALDHPVRIAGQIREARLHRGLLVEAMDGDHREELLHGPDVRCALEDREVAVVDAAQPLIEDLELLRDVLEASRAVLDGARSSYRRGAPRARDRASRGSRT